MPIGCYIPLCTNESAEGWPVCAPCMRATVRRFLHAEGVWPIDAETVPNDPVILDRARFWIEYILQNIETLVEAEQRNIIMFGADYDRDSDSLVINLEFEER